MNHMESGRAIVVQEWYRRRPVKLDTSGGWHTCSSETCEIIHLLEYVCLDGEHIVPGPRCREHAQSAVVYVTDLYVCKAVGCVHTCDQATCTIRNGRCQISGRCCIAATRSTLSVPASNKRSRRRSNCVHTSEQSACILLYDLLFSNRRISSEILRASSVLDIARRAVQRCIKGRVRDRVDLHYQELVDIYASARQRLRHVDYLTVSIPDKGKQEICTHYAKILVAAWEMLVSSLPPRSTYDSTIAALLYAMRKGVACDGVMAIPMDRFLAYALPDAHAIKDVNISRRSLTQAKNALYDATQDLIRRRNVPVERLAALFSNSNCPEVLQHYLNHDELE